MRGLRKILVAVAGAAVCCVTACGARHHVTASAERLRQHRTEMHIRSRRHQRPAASSPSFGSGPGKTRTETLTKTLADNIFRITVGAGGEIGVAVIAGGDTVAVNDSCVYQLMSVFKVHQALAVCERLDREGSTLDTLLTFRRRDLDPATWSPMMKDHPEPSLTMPVASLLRYSLIQSGNNAGNAMFSRLVNVHETDSFTATLIPRARFRITYAESEMSADHAKAYGNRTSPLGAAMLMGRLFTGSIVSREKQDFMTECLYGSTLQLLAELYLLVVRPGNDEILYPVLPERKRINMVVQQMEPLRLYQPEQTVNILDIQCDMVYRPGLHDRLVVLVGLDDKIVQL